MRSPQEQPGLEQLFQVSSDPLFVIDPAENRILDANDAACQMLGYGREELLVTPISDIHPAELSQLQAFCDAAVRDGTNWTISLSCRTKSGAYLPTETALLALTSGGRVYLIGLVRDRSEHRGRNT